VPTDLIRASIYGRGEIRYLLSVDEESTSSEPATSGTEKEVELKVAIAKLPDSAKWAVQEYYYRKFETDKPPFEDNGLTLANTIKKDCYASAMDHLKMPLAQHALLFSDQQRKET
jgi:hypothetical protein